MKAQSIQLIMAPESMMAVVVTMFRVAGETMTETGMYRDCFLQLRDLRMVEGDEGGDRGVSRIVVAWRTVGVTGEGVDVTVVSKVRVSWGSGVGLTERAAKWFEGLGKGIVGVGVRGWVKGAENLEGPEHFWIKCPGCLHQKQSQFLVQHSCSSGVKGPS